MPVVKLSFLPSLHLQDKVIAVSVLVARRVGPLCRNPYGALFPITSFETKLRPLNILQQTHAHKEHMQLQSPIQYNLKTLAKVEYSN